MSPELFDRFQELGWPILKGGRRVRLANGQVVDTPTRELLAEVSVTSSRTGERHRAEVLLGELELMGDATITLGRDVTVQLHLDEWLESGVADARREMQAMEFRKLQCLRRVWSVWRQRVSRQRQLWSSLALRRRRRAFRGWLHHAEAPILVAYRRRQLQAKFRSKVQQLGMSRMTDTALDRQLGGVLAVHDLSVGEDGHPLGPDCDKMPDIKGLQAFREVMRDAVKKGASFFDIDDADVDLQLPHEPQDTLPGPLVVDGRKIVQFPNNGLGRRLWAVWQSYAELGEPLKPGDHIRHVPDYVPQWKGSKRPTPQKMRPPPRNFREVEEIIQQWLDLGIVEEVKYPVRHSHPVFLHTVTLPDGSKKLRLVCDYATPGGVNSCLDTISYEAKTLDMVVDILLQSGIKSTIDVQRYFHLLPIRESERHWFALNWNGRTLLPTRVMFGASQSPAWSVSIMNATILGDLLNAPKSKVGVVIDDVCFGSDDDDECVEQFTAVLERFKHHNVRVSFQKMRVGFKEIDGVLGYKLSGNKMALSDRRLQGIANLTCPTTPDEARVFIGFVNYLQKYVPGLSLLLSSTQELACLAKGRGKRRPAPVAAQSKDINWAEIELAFGIVKDWLLCKPFLYAVDYNHSLYVSTDASRRGCAAFVFQLIPDERGRSQLRPVSFWSHRWTAAQRRRLHITELEALGAFLGCLRHKELLQLTPFYLCCDARNQVVCRSSSNPLIHRAMLGLEGLFAPMVKLHVPGSANVPSDACSRLCAVQPGSVDAAGSACGRLCAVRPRARRDMRTARERAIARWKRERAIEPARQSLLEEHHVKNGAHVGVAATLDSLKESRQLWDGVAADVEWWVRTCKACQANRTPMLPKQSMKSIITVLEPFSRVQVDVWHPKETSKDGYKYVLVCVDVFSMAVKLYKLKSLTAEAIIPKLVDLMCFYGGVTEVLYTDDAGVFRSTIMKAFTEACNLQHRLVAPYHHNANGYAEHECYEVVRVLRNLLFENKKMNSADWPQYLPLVEWIRNSTPRLSRAGLSPRQIIAPNVKERAAKLDDSVDVGRYMQQWIKTQNHLIELVRCELAEWMDSRLRHIKAERSTKCMTYEPGDFVLVRSMAKIGRSKLARPFTGPFEVLGPGSTGSGMYELFEVLTGEQREEHRDQLKLFHYRSMDDLVPMAMGGTDFVNLKCIISHVGSRKTGANAYRFMVESEEGDVFESNWNDVNRSNAYIRYRQEHPEFRLPESTQAPVAGTWSVTPDYLRSFFG